MFEKIKDINGEKNAGVLTILHFNDVYNVEPQAREPVGGAARFCGALKTFAHLDPLILFSGDIFAPSIMSTFTKGEQMIPVLNSCGVHCAVFGNHDFDFGVDCLIEFTKKTKFPWLMSNVVDIETSRPLAEGHVTCIITHGGRKLGLVGLVEEEWLATLATLDRDEVIYLDFVAQGRALANHLKQVEGCEYVIALTHMRTPNDILLAQEVEEIDLILGGHDHVYEISQVKGRHVIKSGTDFRQFSKITLTFDDEGALPKVDVEEINITSDFPEDIELAGQLSHFSNIVEGKMDEVLGHFSVELDGRFSSIRTKETNLGNFVCGVMLAATHADLAILNSGTLRSDKVHPKGEFLLRDLVTILPMMDPLVVIEATGEVIWKALENGVSLYPRMEGRFPQVAGVSFKFDPRKPPGQRISPDDIMVGDEPLELTQCYRLVTKSYLHQGRDGYDVLKTCKVLVSEDESPELCMALQNHFQSIKVFTNSVHHLTNHRQSLVCISRRHSAFKQHEVNCHLRRSLYELRSSPTTMLGADLVQTTSSNTLGAELSLHRHPSVEEIEVDQCRLSPMVDGRIINLAEQQN